MQRAVQRANVNKALQKLKMVKPYAFESVVSTSMHSRRPYNSEFKMMKLLKIMLPDCGYVVSFARRLKINSRSIFSTSILFVYLYCNNNILYTHITVIE